jgi:hypothetical protein
MSSGIFKEMKLVTKYWYQDSLSLGLDLNRSPAKYIAELSATAP